VDFVLPVFGRLSEQFREISSVHGKDEIEGFEIGLADLPRTLQGNIDAMLAGDCDGSAIRGGTGVPTAGAGGIDSELARQASGFGKVCQNAFGKR